MVRSAILLAAVLGGVCPLHATAIPDFAKADLVLGQPDFTTAALPPQASAASLVEPSAVVVDPVSGKIFVADTDNNRVLRYAGAASLQNGADAEAVFGQPDFTTSSALPAGASTLDSPTGLYLDAGGRLWVADSDNNRVVMYVSAVTASNGAAATLVLGQPNATSESAANPPSAASLSAPQGLWVDPSGHLWVADTGNNRVLRYDDAASATTGSPAAAADRVLGQQQFDSSSAGTSNQQLSEPVGVAMDGHGTLWVADRANNRILGYPAATGISSGTNAARILGQPDFNGSVSPGTSAVQLQGPSGVFPDDADNLWVLDQGNNRALRFAKIGTIENGQPATGVVGQAGFGTSVTALDARHLDQPFLGIFVEPQGQLWLSDLDHNRVLRFEPADSEAPVVHIKGRRKVTTTKAKIVVRGTASDDVGVTTVTVQLGHKKAKLAQGTDTWKRVVRLGLGRNVIRAVALDAAGRRSAAARIIVLRQ